MKKLFSLVVFVLFSPAAFSADITVKVFDPDSRPISGARVLAFSPDGKVARQATTNAEGVVVLSAVSLTDTVKVFAPGFATAEARLSSELTTLKLKVAAGSETVDVTASATPAASEQSGSMVETLDQNTLVGLDPAAANDALRFLPGAVVNTAGQRGGLASLFVRGGESRYNKVMVDGVPVDEPGGTYDFGVLPLTGVDRIEFLRGAQSSVYGSDAMTSVVQLFSATGIARTPELRFGAEGGSFGTARGSASLAGAYQRFDYNLFAEQFNTDGGVTNSAYNNSSQGANFGYQLSSRAGLRLRTRHYDSGAGVPGEFEFNGNRLLKPDTDASAHQNNFQAGLDLTITAPARWQHRFTGYEYNHKRLNQDQLLDPGSAEDHGFYSPSRTTGVMNRAGFQYQGEYMPRTWARSVFGYEFEDETGTFIFASPFFKSNVHGLRRNHNLYGEQLLTLDRASLSAGLRYVHNETFGDRAVPRLAATYSALKGNRLFSGTQLRAVYAEGIKEPKIEESFATGVFTLPNPALQAEKNRSLEAGVTQGFAQNRISASATYFNNYFRDLIDFKVVNPLTFQGQFVNVNKALAHGAEIEGHARLTSRLSFSSSYSYTSTQILKNISSPSDTGKALLRRPKHLGTILLNYSGTRWGGNLAASFVGRRRDSDFFVLNTPIDHADPYQRLDLGGWFNVNQHATAYFSVGNVLNQTYNEVLGYPALGVNFRLGMRFRVGGDR